MCCTPARLGYRWAQGGITAQCDAELRNGRVCVIVALADKTNQICQVPLSPRQLAHGTRVGQAFLVFAWAVLVPVPRFGTGTLLAMGASGPPEAGV